MKNIGRKIATVALVAIMTLGSVYGFSATEVQASPVIRVTVDGRQVHFPDQQPVNIDGRILVPVRGVFEEMGFEAMWNPERAMNNSTFVEFDGRNRDIAVLVRATTDRMTVPTINIIVPMGVSRIRRHAVLAGWGESNTTEYALDVPAQIINGRTMVPLRAVVEAIGEGYAVAWDGANNTVVATTPAWTGGAVTPPVVQPPVTPPVVQPPVNKQTPPVVQPPVNNTPAPPATDEGFVDINGFAPVVKTAAEWRAVGENTMVGSVLPNRRLTDAERQAWISSYDGLNAYEIEVIRLINEIRVEHGLNQLRFCHQRSLATRFHSQILRDTGFVVGQGSKHTHGPYGGSSSVFQAFGMARSGAIATHAFAPQASVDSWMASEGHRNIILCNNSSTIGAGVLSRSYVTIGN